MCTCVICDRVHASACVRPHRCGCRATASRPRPRSPPSPPPAGTAGSANFPPRAPDSPSPPASLPAAAAALAPGGGRRLSWAPGSRTGLRGGLSPTLHLPVSPGCEGSWPPPPAAEERRVGTTWIWGAGLPGPPPAQGPNVPVRCAHRLRHSPVTKCLLGALLCARPHDWPLIHSFTYALGRVFTLQRLVKRPL